MFSRMNHSCFCTRQPFLLQDKKYLEFPQVSEVKQSCHAFLTTESIIQHPGEALCGVDTEVLELIDSKRGVVPSLLLTKVHYQLLSFANRKTSGSGPLLLSGRLCHCYL